jgi:UDP-glucose 4-epimerase
MTDQSSKTLVTGGAGFVGAGVVRALRASGRNVVVLDSGVAAGFGYVDRTGAEIVRGDIRDRDAVARSLVDCAAVVHLAAQASVPESIADPMTDREVNVDATLTLLEAVRSHGISRFIFASSNAVVGGHPPPSNEGLVPHPVSPYGAAKAAVEAYLVAYREAYGLETVALRFANAYGPWSAHKSSVVAAFTKAYLRGGPIRINGTGQQTRDYVHVSDIARAIVACLDAPASAVAGETFQIGSGVETSLIELASRLFEAGGEDVPIEYGPPSPGDIPRNVSDISKAVRSIGYRPTVALPEGLTHTLEWFRSP